MSIDKISQVKYKLASVQTLLQQLKTEHAADAMLIPTGDLATARDDCQKLLSLHKMEQADGFIKMIEIIKDKL